MPRRWKNRWRRRASDRGLPFRRHRPAAPGRRRRRRRALAGLAADADGTVAAAAGVPGADAAAAQQSRARRIAAVRKHDRHAGGEGHAVETTRSLARSPPGRRDGACRPCRRRRRGTRSAPGAACAMKGRGQGEVVVAVLPAGYGEGRGGAGRERAGSAAGLRRRRAARIDGHGRADGRDQQAATAIRRQSSISPSRSASKTIESPQRSDGVLSPAVANVKKRSGDLSRRARAMRRLSTPRPAARSPAAARRARPPRAARASAVWLVSRLSGM